VLSARQLWRIDESKQGARAARPLLTMTVTTPHELTDGDTGDVVSEAGRFLQFVDADADHEVKLGPII